MTVLLVEDHEMVASGFRAVLDEEPDLEVVGRARTASEGVELTRELRPTVVLMDYRLPDLDGATAAAQIRADSPDTAVLLVTGVETEAAVAAALDAGCAGFVSKGRGIIELAHAIRAAAAGAAVFPSELLAAVAGPSRLQSGTHDLTARELEVLGLLAEGCSTEEIASRLVVSLHTVRNHVRNILTKLGARTKLEAVVVAARAGVGGRGPGGGGGGAPRPPPAPAPRFRRFLGLRVRIFLLIVLLVGPLFLLVKVGSDREHDQARDDVERALGAAARGVARSEEDLVGRSHLILDALVRVPEALGESEACRAFLRSVVDAEARYANIALFERDGTARCSASPLPEGYRASGNPSFTRALANGDFAVGSYRIDAFGPRLSVAHAASDARGEARSVAVAWINLDWLSEAEAVVELREGSVVTVVADDGMILARLPDPDGHVGGRVEAPLLKTVRGSDTGIARERDVDGVERLLAHRPLAAPSGGYVYVGTPVDVAYSAADAAYRDELLWLGAIALLMLVTALVLSEVFVLAPIRRLRDTVRRLGSGDLSARARVATRGEVGELARAFDEMTVALAEREEEAAVATREVEHALAELERSQRALKRMLGAVVTAQEEERRRIAGEVHDDAVQAMTAHLLGLQLLRRRLADTEHATQVAALEQTAAEAIDRLRRLLFDLHTPVLDYQGLAAACEALLSRTFEGGDTTWHVDDHLPDEPPEIVRTVAYRIAQEAIVNVYRHAHAAHLEVTLAIDDGTLVVSVRDDGRGFAGDMPTPGHFGIETMRQRAALAGGELTIVSEPGRGTDVRCRLPLGTDTRAAWIPG